jgi:ADP-ribose pyrophosphatase
MKQHGPWKIKESIEKYKNKWMTVVEHQVIRPDGKDGIFGITTLLPGAYVLPLDEEGNVYLVKEFKFAIGRELIEIASGGLDAGETKEEGARRELKEELGIVAKEVVPLGYVESLTSIVVCTNALFLARGLTFENQELEGTEVIQMVKVPFSEAVRMVMEGDIIDGPSCVLILKAQEYLRKNNAL